VDAKLQRRVQRYGWDLASHEYHCLSQEQLAPARNGMRKLSALEPGQQVLDLRHASLPPVRPPVRTSKVIVDGLRQATVRARVGSFAGFNV
jgi:hypothetical protein